MDLQAIEARLEAITETPWEERSEGIGEPWFVVHDSEYVAYVASLRSDQPADAEFIARAPEDIRALIAEVKRLEAWKREAVTVMDGLQGLGEALRLPLGKQVTGRTVLEKVKGLNND